MTLRKFIKYYLPPILLMLVIFAFSARQRISVADEYILNFVFFKSLHVIEYAALFALWYRAFFSGRKNQGKAALFSFMVVLAYAISDEYHQSFVVTREGQLRDVIIDGIGALISWLTIKRLVPVLPKKLKALAVRLDLL